MLEAAAPRPHGARRFALSFALLFTCLTAWALATPMFGSADEQVHMVTAYAVVHGVDGHTNAAGKREFVVPAVYTGETVCYAFRPETSASCLYFDSGAPDHVTTSTAWTYPPFYYLLVGWPTFLSSGLAGLYLMRIVAAVWAAALVALALQNLELLRGRGPMLVGVSFALTPAVFSFGAAVNPSGMSFAAAMAVWTGGLALARVDRLARPAQALARVGAPLCLFLLLRRDTVVWASLIGSALLVIMPAERRRELARSRVAWAWVGAAVAAAAVQLSFSGASTADSLVSVGRGSLADTWAEMPHYLDQVGGGILGWLDTRLPELVYHLFTYGSAVLAVVGICIAPRRVAVAIGAVTCLVFAAPLVIGSIRYGYIQGRYVLPFAFGVPLLGALGVAERLRTRQVPPALAIVTLAAIAVAQVASFSQAMHRFTAGAHGAWWFASPPPWEPPMLPPTVLWLVFVAAVTALLAWIYVLTSPGPEQVDGIVIGTRRSEASPRRGGMGEPAGGAPVILGRADARARIDRP